MLASRDDPVLLLIARDSPLPAPRRPILPILTDNELDPQRVRVPVAVELGSALRDDGRLGKANLEPSDAPREGMARE